MARLPTHLLASALIRRVEGEGGFATVLTSGERDAGTLMIVVTDRGGPSVAYERMPQADGTSGWTPTRVQDVSEPRAFDEYLERRRHQDRDLWVIELDVPHAERFIDGLDQT